MKTPKPKKVSSTMVAQLARRWAADREKVFSAERIKANDAEAERLLSVMKLRQEFATTQAPRKGITSEKGYRVALKAIEALWDAKPGSREHDCLEVLAVLVEDYEHRTSAME